MIVADSWTVSTGQIIAAHPDLVIAAVPYQEQAVTEILKSGARFLGLAPKTLADIYTDIAAIAGIMGASDRAEPLIEAMQREIEEVRQQTDGSQRPRVFCEEWGRPLICSQPWVAELVQAAGGDFVGTPGKQTSADAVLLENPDVVVAAWCGAGNRVPLEKIIRDRGWQVPTYRMPDNRGELVLQRAVIRNGFTHDLAGMLVRDIKRHLEWFASQPGLKPTLDGAGFHH